MTKLALVAALSLTLAPAVAQDKGQPGGGPAEKAGDSAKQMVALATQVSRSVVHVEFRARYDKGESPGDGRMAGLRRFLPSALRTAMNEGWENWEELVGQERPAERAGVLISPTRVVVADPMLHPRFLKSISVRVGEQLIDATPAAYPKARRYLILELAQPVKGATPITFKPDATGPFYAVSSAREGGVWSTGVAPLPSEVSTNSDGRVGTHCPGESLVTDKSGSAVGLTGLDLLPLDDSWKGSPDAWPKVTQKEMGTLLENLAKETGSGMLRISISLRSPRGQAEGMGRYNARFGRGGEDNAAITEWNGTGLLVDPNTVLVLAGFKPKVTARLESITVHTADGKEISASFAGSLKDWDGFLAKLDKPLDGPVRLSTTPILDQRDRLLLQAMITVRGDAREAYFWRERITDFNVGWDGRVFPEVDFLGQNWGPWGQATPSVRAFFGLDGTLVALEVNRRPKVTADEGPEEGVMVPADLLADLLKDRAKHLETENRPLSEDEENRLAWLGVELQAMDPELARANNVSDQTEGGRTGALVTYIYPDSPAAKAGVKDGDILLRLHVQGQPKPLDVIAGGPDMGAMMDNFWQYLDQMPEEYFDQMPKPWGSAETPLTRALTDVGFGTPFTADIFRDGKVITADFAVTEGPSHFESAKRFKSEELGLTARDLTYEVRRYFKIKAGDPGVIIAKIEKGGKVSVAGLKPFEIITSINDKPVASVEDVRKMTEDALKAGGELRLAVKRMTQGRIVKVKLDAPAPDADGNSKKN